MPSINATTPITSVDASAASGTAAVTVPEGANAAVIFSSGFTNNQFSALSLDGDNFTLLQNPIDNGTTQAYVAILENPTSGNLAWTWANGAWSNAGGNIHIVWIDDANIGSAVRDSDSGGAADGDNPGPLTLTTETSDLVLGYCVSADPQDPAGGGTVILNNFTDNGAIEDISTYSAGDGTTNITMTGLSFSAIAGISLSEAAGGPVELDGASASVSDSEGALALRVGMDAAAASESGSDAALAVTVGMSAAAESASAAAGVLSPVVGLDAVAGSRSTAAAALALETALSGLAASVSGASADLSVGALVALAGTIRSDSDAAGAASILTGLSGQSVSASQLTAALNVLNGFIGSSHSESRAAGLAVLEMALAGNAASISSFVGSLNLSPDADYGFLTADGLSVAHDLSADLISASHHLEAAGLTIAHLLSVDSLHVEQE